MNLFGLTKIISSSYKYFYKKRIKRRRTDFESPIVETKLSKFERLLAPHSPHQPIIKKRFKN